MKLKISTRRPVSFITSLLLCFLLSKSSSIFLDCISQSVLSEIVITPSDTSYTTVLESTIQNLRFATPTTPKPLAIITPLSYSHVQSAVICSVESGLQIRIRSGGHDYEGLSCTSFSHTPFIVLDLNRLRLVTVDSDNKTAWVESGANIGELLYSISKKSNVLGFPAGECPTVGIGGHFSGGGFGMLARKYGLSADNVIDALIVDVNGLILDRRSMGEDLFWAIRGGGGASFGVILAWKINLVYVPPVVTVLSVSKKLDQGTTKLLNKWQHISHNVSEDLFIRVEIRSVSVSGEKNRTLQVTFNSLFLGTKNKLITMINNIFTELQVNDKDCIEMSWIESVVYFSLYFEGESVEALNERRPSAKRYFKVKSDYVKKPLPEEALGQLLKWCLEEKSVTILMEPHGGKMSKINETKTPYPHREGNLYIMQYVVKWTEAGFNISETHVASITRVYDNMTPFVSKNPRGAYLNFRDLDLGTNDDKCGTPYLQASKWGTKYFKGNFKRLAMVKGIIDPTNFFYYEQSIPPLLNGSQYVECCKDGDFHFHQSI